MTYKPKDVAKRIKLILKQNKQKTSDMLEQCNLSKNTLSSMNSGGSMPKSENIAKIADYLNCSVDYLLGRTDNPEPIYQHEDKEIMSAIDDSWNILCNNVISGININNAVTRKLMFNILVEFKGILNSKTMTSHEKSISISLIHDVITDLGIKFDRSIPFNSDLPPNDQEIETYKNKRIQEYQLYLDNFFNDLTK